MKTHIKARAETFSSQRTQADDSTTLTCTIIFCFGKTKYVFGFDRSRDHSKTTYFFGCVLVLPKQRIIVQVSYYVLPAARKKMSR